VLIEKVPYESALVSIKTLLAYAEQQPISDGQMRALHSLLRVVKQRQTEMRRKHTQSTLDAWVDQRADIKTNETLTIRISSL
jgi:hypothetical protein